MDRGRGRLGNHNQTYAGADRRSGERLFGCMEKHIRAAFPGRKKLFHLRFNHIAYPAYFPESSDAFIVFKHNFKKKDK